MTDTISGPSAATRVSATVERYDAAMGYCVLDPGDGSPDLFCPRTALDAVGLDILLAGAIVACETVQGRHGPKVSRIRAVVKWFLPSKGYGFLEPEDGSPDIFCHISAVEASGRDTLPQGAAVTCETVPGDR